SRNRGDSPNMARLRTAASAAGTLRLSNDARNNRPLEKTRRPLMKEGQRVGRHPSLVTEFPENPASVSDLQSEKARFRRVTHPANPFSQASGGTVDCLWRSRVAIPRSPHASTRGFRQSVQTDNDKVAPECNGAVRQERDCLQAATACRGRCAEVSRQSEASMGNRL